MTTTKADLKAVAQGIRDHDDFVISVHESPDGDALGSMLALKLALDQLGKRSTMFLPGTAPLPFEYRFMPLDDLVRGEPDKLLGRPLLALDAANENRMGADQRLRTEAPFVAEASSTSEVLRDIFTELKVRLTPEIAAALYIALVTDTGRFQYENTSPKTLRLAAELIEAGADAHRIFQHVYETIELSKLTLLARALEHVEVHEGGR